MFRKLFVLCLLMTCVASTVLAQKPATIDTTVSTGKMWIGGNELSLPYHIQISNYALTINGWPYYPSLTDLQPKSASQNIIPTNMQCNQQSFVNELNRQWNALRFSKSPDELDEMMISALMQRSDLITRAEPWHGSIKVWWKDGSSEQLSFGPSESEQSRTAGLQNLYTDLVFALKSGYWVIIGADGSIYYVAPSDQAAVAVEIRSASMWANSQKDQRPPRSFKLIFDRVKEFAHPLAKPSAGR